MRKKQLSINQKTFLNVECWTYYRMAVIQTMPNYMNWLSSHMCVFYGTYGERLYFGSTTSPYGPEYYSDILTIEEVNLYDIKPDNIIKQIKSNIDQDYYFVVFLRDENDCSHESFIYGYDDDKQIFMSISFDDSGIFRPCNISYDAVLNGYKNEYEYFCKNPDQYYCKRSFGYNMSRMKPNDKYLHSNYAYEYFEKIYHEVYGTRIDITDNADDIHDFLPTTRHYYTGISCLHVLRAKIKALVENRDENDDQVYVLRKNLFKLLEHRKLLVESMTWSETNWSISDDKLIQLRTSYSEACETFANICYVFLKYEQTGNSKLLINLLPRIEAQYSREKRILGEYAILIREWYCQKVLLGEFDGSHDRIPHI